MSKRTKKTEKAEKTEKKPPRVPPGLAELEAIAPGIVSTIQKLLQHYLREMEHVAEERKAEQKRWKEMAAVPGPELKLGTIGLERNEALFPDHDAEALHHYMTAAWHAGSIPSADDIRAFCLQAARKIIERRSASSTPSPAAVNDLE